MTLARASEQDTVSGREGGEGTGQTWAMKRSEGSGRARRANRERPRHGEATADSAKRDWYCTISYGIWGGWHAETLIRSR